MKERTKGYCRFLVLLLLRSTIFSAPKNQRRGLEGEEEGEVAGTINHAAHCSQQGLYLQLRVSYIPKNNTTISVQIVDIHTYIARERKKLMSSFIIIKRFRLVKQAGLVCSIDLFVVSWLLLLLLLFFAYFGCPHQSCSHARLFLILLRLLFFVFGTLICY